MTDADRARLIERLREAGRRQSEFSRRMAEAKSLRQTDNPEGRSDLYSWETPEQTDSWQAAELLAAFAAPPVVAESGEVEKLRDLLKRYAVNMSYDCPGDVPEPCGLWCDLCKEHVEDDGTGHSDTCVLAPRALPASQGAREGEG